MRMNLIIEVMDVPGQLVSILNPVSELGVNIVTIVHKREIVAVKSTVIELVLEGERENLLAVIDKFSELGVNLVEVDDSIKKEKLSVIIYGHIIDKDLRDTFDRVNVVNGLVVSDLKVRLNGEEESAALITIKFDSGKKEVAYNKIIEIAEEKDYLVIDEV